MKFNLFFVFLLRKIDMGFLQYMLGNLLPDKQEETSAESEVIVREAIVPTKTFETDFAAWLEAGMHKGLLDYLKECFVTRKADPSAAVNLYFHESKNSNGFYFRAENPWNTQDYRFLVHLFAKKLIALNYVQNHATREVIEEGGVLKIKEEYFLKPTLKLRKQIPYEQLFGNIFIEHRIKGDETELVKVMVNTYTDQYYNKPYYFEDFLTELCLP